MAFKVKIKGQVHEPRQPDYTSVMDAPGEPFPYDSTDHAEAIAWATYISMSVLRQEAIDLYAEWKVLAEEIDARAGHPKVGAAIKKLQKIENKINSRQIDFLKHERVANYVWRSMSQRDREITGIRYWFNTPDSQPELWGLWHTHWEACPPPPREFRIREVPALTMSPAQEKGYWEVVKEF